MVKLISLSERSKKIIGQLSQMIDDPMLSAWNKRENDEILRLNAIVWLSQKRNHDKKSRFLLESLRAALLEDLHDSFLSPDERCDKKEALPSGWFNKAQFVFLATAGTLLAICEGFDGIASILGSFAAVPTALVFIAGIAFSLLSVSVFYALDLMEIADSVGVKLGKSTQLLDIFMEQVEQINALRKRIDDCYTDESTNANERQALKQMIAMLVIRYDALDEARKAYKDALNNAPLNVAKLATEAMTALFFFSGGFFAGQTLALAIAGLFVASVSATLWPVVVASVVVGLAALSLYWFVQRPGLESIFGHWLGLDKKSIDVFAGDDIVTKEKQELCKLEKKFTRLENLHNKIEQLTKCDKTSSQATVDQATQTEREPTNTRRHTFFNRPRARSLSDLNDQVLLGLGVA